MKYIREIGEQLYQAKIDYAHWSDQRPVMALVVLVLLPLICVYTLFAVAKILNILFHIEISQFLVLPVGLYLFFWSYTFVFFLGARAFSRLLGRKNPGLEKFYQNSIRVKDRSNDKNH